MFSIIPTRNKMRQQNIENYQTPCDKCRGDGKNFIAASNEFFRQWRDSLGVSQTVVAQKLSITVPQLSRYENGHIPFSESRRRQLSAILSRLGDGKSE